MNTTITGLLGDWAPLNPAYMEPCEYDGDTYPTIILAVEASKFDKPQRVPFMRGTGKVADLGYARPYTAKQYEVLEQLLRKRFEPYSKYFDCLMSTGDAEIVYTNDAHRNWFGACTCPQCAQVVKHNYVGEILGRIRSEHKAD